MITQMDPWFSRTLQTLQRAVMQAVRLTLLIIRRKMGKYLTNRDFKVIKNLHCTQAKRHFRRRCGSNVFRKDEIGHFLLSGLGEGFREEAS